MPSKEATHSDHAYSAKAKEKRRELKEKIRKAESKIRISKQEKLREKKSAVSSVEAIKKKNRKDRSITKISTSADNLKSSTNLPSLDELKEMSERARLDSVYKYKLDRFAVLEKMVARKQMTQEESERQYIKECAEIDRNSRFAGDAKNCRGEDDPVVVIAPANQMDKMKKGQISTSIDPYCEGGKIVQVGLLPENQNWEEISLRFDYNYILVQKKIDLPATPDHIALAYWVWAIIKLKTGDSPDDEKTLKTGKKVKPFAFSGPLTKLSEFHLALRKHLAAATTRTPPNAQDLVSMLNDDHKDEHGIVDVHHLSQTTYTPGDVVAFGEYRSYIEEAGYKTYSGTNAFHKVLTITKKKSPKAIASARPNGLSFFMVQIPVRNLIILEKCVLTLMLKNGMKVLSDDGTITPAKPPSETDFEGAQASGRVHDDMEVNTATADQTSSSAENSDEEIESDYDSDSEYNSANSSNDDDDDDDDDDEEVDCDSEPEPVTPTADEDVKRLKSAFLKFKRGRWTKMSKEERKKKEEEEEERQVGRRGTKRKVVTSKELVPESDDDEEVKRSQRKKLRKRVA